MNLKLNNHKIIMYWSNNSNYNDNSDYNDYDYTKHYPNSNKDNFNIMLFIFITFIFIFACIFYCTICKTKNLDETIENESLPTYFPRLPSYKSDTNSIILMNNL